MNIVTYLRVSTEDQSNDSQRLELADHCSRQGWTVVAEFSDVISGGKAARPGLDAMLARCSSGVDAVVVVKIDRLGRSLLNVTHLIERLRKMKVAVICTSQGIDTRADSPSGNMVMNILASFAEFERAIIRDRTVSGLRAAKARGVSLGRPSRVLPPEGERAGIVQAWADAGRPGGYRGLAARLGGCSVATALKMGRGVGAPSAADVSPPPAVADVSDGFE